MHFDMQNVKLVIIQAVQCCQISKKSLRRWELYGYSYLGAGIWLQTSGDREVTGNELELIGREPKVMGSEPEVTKSEP